MFGFNRRFAQNIIRKVKLMVPPGFTNRWNPPFSIYKNGSVYYTDFGVSSLIPPVTKIYYVDPNGGSDTNAGNTRAAPLKNLATALAKTDVDQIRIINMTTDYIARTTAGWNNVQPSRSISVINEGPGRFISTKAGSSTPPTWTVNGTYSNVYQTTITAANAAKVVDLSRKTTPSNPYSGNPVLNVPASYQVLTGVTSIAAVAALAGSWYHDGTNLYVRASDDRSLVGSTNMVPMASTGNNGRYGAATAGLTLYVDGIDFVGGSAPFLALPAAQGNTGVIAFTNCSFQASSGASNGLSIQGKLTVYVNGCGAYYNGADGFNYHSFTATDTGTTDASNSSPNWFEWGCCAWGNGTTGNTGVSDNASTSHDYCNGVRLNNTYVNSDDVVVADTNSSYVWEVGCTYGPSVKGGASNDNNAALVYCKKWIVGGRFANANGAGAYQLSARDAGAQALYRDCLGVSNTGGLGTIGAF